MTVLANIHAVPAPMRAASLELPGVMTRLRSVEATSLSLAEGCSG